MHLTLCLWNVQNCFKKLMTVDPSQRTTLEDIMKDPWVNIGQEEKLKLYSKLPWGHTNPQTTEIMKNLGFKQQHEIQELLTDRKYSNIMCTYMIIHTTENKMKVHTIKVRPCPSPNSNNSLSTTQDIQASGQKTNKSASPPANLKSRMPSPPPSMEARMSPPPAKMEVRMTTSLSSLKSRMTTPLPARV